VILEQVMSTLLNTVSGMLHAVLPAAGDLNIDIPSGWLLAYNWLNGFLPMSDGLAVAGLVGSAGYNATMTLGGAAIARPIATTGVAPAAWLAAALPFLILGIGGRRGRLGRVAGGALVVGYFAYLIALYQ